MLLIFMCLSPLSAFAADKKKFVVVIDAGHGGNDYGAIEHEVNEKDVNLAVALKLGNLIKKKLKDTEVVYTRDGDYFISLQKRADIANNAKADIFISIHCNSVDKKNKNRANVVGATTYVLGRHKDADNLAVARRENSVVELDANDRAHYSEFDPSKDESHIIFEMTQKKNLQNSVRFAADVQKEMQAAGRYSRGVQQAGFWVLWSTAMPAALIELDFICNPEQAKFLKSEEGQDKLADAIFGAVKKYESYFRKSLGSAPAIVEETADEPVQAVVIKEEPEEEVPRRHRETTATASTRKSNPSSHRRRPASEKNKAQKVEEATIALNTDTEVVYSEDADAPVIAMADSAPAEEPVKKSKQTAKAPKQNAKAEAKKSAKPPVQTASARTGRRDRPASVRAKRLKQEIKVVYKVLLFTSDDQLAANDAAFQGLKPVSAFRENNTFKYTYGESAVKEDMDKTLSEISAIFPEARVIRCYY
ncbi:MAG: N-acetylmuramoyl-L-alanine amidase [Muribaculaceae bacterium]|nr:N-acetylmuramoyl-L-alanine amidase [Muribaculaceae bacterium]